MTAIFRTREESPAEVAIVGVGLLLPFGEGGIPLDKAAQFMGELQQKEEDGTLKLDKDGNPIPLSGAELTKAAQAFAEAREIEVATAAQDEEEEPEKVSPANEKEKK